MSRIDLNIPRFPSSSVETDARSKIVEKPAANNAQILCCDPAMNTQVDQWINRQDFYKPAPIQDLNWKDLAICRGSLFGKAQLFFLLPAFQRLPRDSSNYGTENRGDVISKISTAIKNSPLTQTESIDKRVEEMRALLTGKKVLVIGDDRGTLSTILRLGFGADAWGVEADKSKVFIANSGLMAPQGRKDMHVMHGDLWDLTLPTSELRERIDGIGKFDAIVSYNVFAYGSMGEVPYERAFVDNINPNQFRKEVCNALGIKEWPENSSQKIYKFFEGWLNATRSMLSHEGIHVHLSLGTYNDTHPFEPPSGYMIQTLEGSGENQKRQANIIVRRK